MTLFLCLFLSVNGLDFQWPIDTKHGQTASFGEYRGARFHMGVDFSTGGVEGMAVRPAADGRVYRVRSIGRGYGKVIYMRHDGGLRTVYAHLAAFEGDLAKVIRSAGKDPASEFGTLELNHAVKKTDLIAYTGESGAGLPHLHFELRDKNDAPLNPLDYNFPKLPHSGTPVLQGLTVVPATPEARVNDAYWPHTLSGKSRTIRVKGKVFLKVDAHIAGSRGSRLGVRQVSIYDGDMVLAAWEPGKLTFKENPTAAMVFDQAHSGFGPTRFTYCFDGRALAWPQPEGYQSLSPINVTAKRVISVGVTDMYGKETRFKFNLDPSAPIVAPSAPTSSPLQATTLTLDAWNDQLRLSVHTPGKLALPDRLAGLGPGDMEQITLEGTKPYLLKWSTDGGRLARHLGRFPGRSDFKLDMDNWTIAAKGLPDTMESVIYTAPADKKLQADSLEVASPVLRFGLEGWPAKGVSVEYPGEDDADQLGYYAYSFIKKRWRYQQNLNEGPFELTALAPFVVARDISPPVVRAPRRHKYFVGTRTVIPLRDKGSGIDKTSITVTRNNNPVEITYDGDRRWITLPPNSGRGPFKVTVRDRAGNETEQLIRN